MEQQFELQTTQSLLSQVQTIIDKHDEIAQIKGEKFNIFEVLGLEWKETQLHSKLLANLLDPKGSHGMGSLFLESFVSKVLCLKTDEFNCKSAKVEIEKSFIAEGIDLSRIDILITSRNRKDQHLIIENKITAADQFRQLERYSKYFYNGLEPRLFYLTRFGESPSEDSLGELTSDRITKISYRTDILKWVEQDCLPITYDQYGLNRVLHQYALSIKNITNQSRTKEMETDLVKIIGEPQNIRAAFRIANSLASVKARLFNEVFLEQLNKAFKGKLYFETKSNIKNYPSDGLKLKNPEIEPTELYSQFNEYFIGIWISIDGYVKLSLCTEGKFAQNEFKQIWQTKYKDQNEELVRHLAGENKDGWNNAIWHKQYKNFGKVEYSNFWISIANGTMANELEIEIATLLAVLEGKIGSTGDTLHNNSHE